MKSEEHKMEIGPQIRERRQELGLSLRELAERVGVTASFLSQVERDLSSPSIDSLRKISDALQVPIFYFLVDPLGKSPVVRKGERIRLKRPNSELYYELLTPDLNRHMEAFLIEREPGDEKTAEPLRQYTEEFIYVLEGQLLVELNQKTFLLDAGDSIYFEGPLLQRIEAAGDTTLRFISVITPPVF